MKAIVTGMYRTTAEARQAAHASERRSPWVKRAVAQKGSTK